MACGISEASRRAEASRKAGNHAQHAKDVAAWAEAVMGEAVMVYDFGGGAPEIKGIRGLGFFPPIEVAVVTAINHWHMCGTMASIHTCLCFGQEKDAPVMEIIGLVLATNAAALKVSVHGIITPGFMFPKLPESTRGVVLW